MKKIGFAALALGVLAVGFLGDRAPPPLERIAPEQVRLLESLSVVRESGKGKPGPYALVKTDRGTARIDRLCFLSGCNLPPDLAALRAGEALSVWQANGHVLQLLRQDGETLLSYDAMYAAYEAQHERRIWLTAGLALIAIVIALVVMRKKPAPAGTQLATRRFRFSIRLGSKADAEEERPSGITVQRRAVDLATLPGFQEAIARGDAEAAVRVLTAAQFSESAARLAVDSVLKRHPAK